MTLSLTRGQTDSIREGRVQKLEVKVGNGNQKSGLNFDNLLMALNMHISG